MFWKHYEKTIEEKLSNIDNWHFYDGTKNIRCILEEENKKYYLDIDSNLYAINIFYFCDDPDNSVFQKKLYFKYFSKIKKIRKHLNYQQKLFLQKKKIDRLPLSFQRKIKLNKDD
jgi:hypothetical protein